MLSDNQMEQFATITFLKGVIAERMGMIGEIPYNNTVKAIEEWLLFLSSIQDGLCGLGGAA